MQIPPIIVIYFFYGLAFFCMGVLVWLESVNAPDLRLRKALKPLAAFGIIHGMHEWLEMFVLTAKHYDRFTTPLIIETAGIAILAISFVSLAASGSLLLAKDDKAQRLWLLVPLGLEAVWVFGLFAIQTQYPVSQIFAVSDVWTRYSLAIPAALLAAAGLIAQQQKFREAGLKQFGQDTLWAAVAFIWYGVIGQVFVQPSALFPSNIINNQLFIEWFGFPVQLFRAAMAVMASVFIVRSLRAFQVETQRKIEELQAARLRDAQARERLRGELFKRIVSAQEAERQRIARDLHDETGQALTAIGLGVSSLEKQIRNCPINRRNEGLAIVIEIKKLIDHSLEELQRVISDLRPAHLDDLGLSATIRWYSTMVQNRTKIAIKVADVTTEQDLPESLKITLFRILQEALTNIVKHANATNASITLVYEPNHIRLKIQDDGCGFDVESARKKEGRIGLGLAGMQERSSLLGGTFSLYSAPGSGTSIEVRIPYHSADEKQNTEIEHENPLIAG